MDCPKSAAWSVTASSAAESELITTCGLGALHLEFMERAIWTFGKLHQELSRVLLKAGLTDTAVQTYVGRSEILIRWLDGDYHPRGPH